MVSWIAGSPEGALAINAAGLPVFTDSTRCLKALAALLRLAAETPAPTPAAAAPRLGLHEIERLLGGSEPGPRDEFLSKALLRAAGVRAVAERLVTSPDEAVAAADDLGYPVAVKVCAAAIPHKSEHGLVRLGLADATAVARACADLEARLREAFPSVPVRGLLVQQMAPRGIEMVIGGKRDPTFGPIVMAGLGGVFVEYMKDVAFGSAPVTHEHAVGMIRSLRAYPLLTGARGQAEADQDALAGAIVAISRLAVDGEQHIREIDVNPLIVLPPGEGAVAVDGLIVVDPLPATSLSARAFLREG
jgi:acyl-CoA synthetase (NDP forming)